VGGEEEDLHLALLQAIQVVLVVEVLLIPRLEEQEQTTQGQLNKVILAEMALLPPVAVVVVPAAVGHLDQDQILVDPVG
jgi:hypothetical protein